MNDILKDIKTTISVDGIPKCDVYTAQAALDRSREEQEINPTARVVAYQWDNHMHVYNSDIDGFQPEY